MNEWEFNALEEGVQLDRLSTPHGDVTVGGRVILRPRAGGDIFDMALAGKTAVIESIEQDYESRVHIAVVIEDDPGRDLGELRQPGHRFFFSPDEVEPLEADAADGSSV